MQISCCKHIKDPDKNIPGGYNIEQRRFEHVKFVHVPVRTHISCQIMQEKHNPLKYAYKDPGFLYDFKKLGPFQISWIQIRKHANGIQDITHIQKKNEKNQNLTADQTQFKKINAENSPKEQVSSETDVFLLISVSDPY